MNVHVLQHVPFEGLGSMEPWLRGRGASLKYTRFFGPWTLPDPAELDLLIILGGPMSVQDEDVFPWLVQEKQFIREVMARDVAVLGVCLGAQLIASALGASVRPAAQREIGWFDMDAVPSGGDHFTFPAQTRVFHWHGETFDLPPGALHLARSVACENQAFQIGSRVIGLQFHLETTPESAQAMVDHCRDEWVPDEFVQSAATILGAPADSYQRANLLMADVLSYLTTPPAPAGSSGGR